SQDSLGAAGGVVKSMVFYAAASFSDADLNADYNTAVSANVAKVINVSLGECETGAKSDGTEATDDQIFETAVAQGQTFAVASGDSGSYECGGRTNEQSYPAVSPYVIAVGGTTLSTTSGGVWSSETAWSCTSYRTCPQSADGGGGGGPSTTEAAPSWQVSSGVLGTSTKRGVPDIAFDANPESGSLPIVDGTATQYGGTSLATPIFVGFWARIQSAHSNGLVFPATALYKYGSANESTIFHDVTSGSNGGYSAKAGWDYVTGFGSLNVGAFATFVTNNAGF
ncbi:MAG TPA: S53 family peptidase, partial [Burkholderiaceae bacterium]|nr:S53 family peptidase [Burkholderiaceae bacterium]